MLPHALEDNNYPNWFIKKTFNRFKFSKIEEQEKSKTQKGIVTLPYVPDITEVLNHIITKPNFRVCTKPLRTIKQILRNLKHPTEPKQQSGVIYEIPCLDCDGIYIGETGWAFGTRCIEHTLDVNPKI